MKMTWSFVIRRILLCGLLVGGALALASCGPRSEAPRHIFVFTLDTLRADHLGAYGYPRDVSPFLDRVASEGVLFERAVASSSTTMACHASLFSALQPPQHRLLRNGEELDESVFTMAEYFGQQGYKTAAFSTVAFTRGLRQGFDVFEAEGQYYPARHVLGLAESWLAEQDRTQPLFVWIHLFDVHEWHNPENLDPDFRGEARRRTEISDDELLGHLRDRQGIEAEFFGGEAELFEVIDPYDDQIASLDAALADFEQVLARLGLDEDSLWIVTGDHGEGLGSHQFNGHGAKIYNEQTHVPLILRFADRLHAGRRVERLVRHVDLLPTLAEMVDAPLEGRDATWAGESLLPILDGRDRGPRRAAFSQRRDADERRLRLGWEPGEIYSLETEDYKYIYRSEGEDEFYDLRADPLELNNLVAEPSPLRQRMETYLAELFENLSRQGAGRREGEILPEHVEELKALGYL